MATHCTTSGVQPAPGCFLFYIQYPLSALWQVSLEGQTNSSPQEPSSQSHSSPLLVPGPGLTWPKLLAERLTPEPAVVTRVAAPSSPRSAARGTDQQPCSRSSHCTPKTAPCARRFPSLTLKPSAASPSIPPYTKAHGARPACHHLARLVCLSPGLPALLARLNYLPHFLCLSQSQPPP